MLVPFNSSSMREVMIEDITDFNISCNSPKYDVILYIAKELESIFEKIFFMSTSLIHCNLYLECMSEFGDVRYSREVRGTVWTQFR